MDGNQIRELLNIYKKIADDVWGKNRKLKLNCRVCEKKTTVDPAYCLANGWPRCCDETMMLESPLFPPEAKNTAFVNK